ncbi:3'-5' exonuclease [Microplitis demolitor]|uniref:3'-5' exonuclease n=1 Tax=Microplitis demolitor TaxID=69319 RepID=UPI0004CDD934|nr:3'-5' exonuclease [Microplitis demolitor]
MTGRGKSAVKYEKDNIIEGRVIRRSTRLLPESLKKNLKTEELQIKNKELDISSLPLINFAGKIYYATDFEGCAILCDQVIERINKFATDIVPIGFDLEWPFSFQTGSGKTALAQVCVSEKTCHLFHIYNFKKLPASFILLLSHPKVRLVGVNIKNDCWKLSRDFPEFPAQKVVENNCIDCGPFYNRVYNRSCRWSLQRLTACLLDKQISKDAKVRTSRWHILPLNDEQKSYAATDAYVSLLLYLTIQKKAEEIERSKIDSESKDQDAVIKDEIKEENEQETDCLSGELSESFNEPFEETSLMDCDNFLPQDNDKDSKN